MGGVGAVVKSAQYGQRAAGLAVRGKGRLCVRRQRVGSARVEANADSLWSATDLGPPAPRTSRGGAECRWCGAPRTIRGIPLSPFRIWR